MTASEFLAAASAFLAEHRGALMVGALAFVVVALLLTIRRAVKGGRPDRWVDAIAFLGALSFSAEGMWEVATQKLGLPATFAALVFFLFEAQLVSAMFRANRYQKLNGNPGRHGRAVWLIAGVMGLIVAFAADSFVEAPLRLAIPLLAAYQWWLGLTADGVTEDKGATSWRWTPRRLLLWLGAIEPGERDVVAVDRERRVAQMTNLEYRRRHGWVRLAGRRGARLARLSLVADDEMIAEVQRRVDRAGWFDATHADAPAEHARRSKSLGVAASEKRRRVRHHRLVRTVRVTHPAPKIAPAQDVRQDDRTTQEIDLAICVMKAGDPDLAQRRIAHLVGTSEATVRRALRRRQYTSPPPINGKIPELEGAT
jgi:hypothetical protein